jgi:HlyD family secretion protein
MKSKKTIYIVLGVLLVLLLVLKKMNVIGSKPGIEVAVEKVQLRTIIETVTASGKIQPELEVKISADISGEIVELKVKEGDYVKKGDLLCRINPELYRSNLEKVQSLLKSSQANFNVSKSRLEQSKAQYENAEKSFNRNKSLFDKGAISQLEYDASLSQYESAKADIAALAQSIEASQANVGNSKASLDEAKENLRRTSIVAPVDGRISKLNIELGERVLGTVQTSGTELMRIANLNEMEVTVDVNENDVIKIHNNDTSIIEIDAYPNNKFKGVVTEIAQSASNLTENTSAEQVTNFQVKVRILRETYLSLIQGNAESPFKPGMTATVDIQTLTKKNIIAAPIQSITAKSDTSTANKTEEKKSTSNETFFEIVFLNKESKAKLTVVKTGIQDNDYIEIVSGLKVGDEVITAPFKAISTQLKNKSLLKIVELSKLNFDTKEK